MTNAELLAKIKAEIERRKSLLIQHSKLTYNLILETFIKEYDDLLSFLSTLESEHLADARKTLEIKPGDEVTVNGHKIVYDKDKGYVTIVKSEESVPNDIEEAAKEYAEGIIQREDALMCKQAFIAGSKWQAEQLLKSSPLPEDTVLFNKGVQEGRRLAEEEQADLFTIVALDAAQRAKEQMMKEAVEGMVEYDYSTGDTDYLRVLAEISSNQFDVKDGDKVRVIVLPKED